MPTNLIKANNIKKAVEELDKDKSIGSISGDVAIELNKKVEHLLNEAIKRAKSNNRRTLFGRDL
ncbi:MAG: hypothetical protein WC796_00390 [Candidatus Pacearchaeota archaeon]|jgi:histone H3/H4